MVKNLPELTGLKFVMLAPICMSMCVAAAIESVGRGLGNVVLAVKGWHNIPGRYGARGARAQETVSGPMKYTSHGMYAGPRSMTPPCSSSGTCISTTRPTT